MEQQIMAAEKLAATGRFMRMLGHEIRNPLNNIDLAVAQLHEESQDEELEYYFDVIGRNSKRINQLLTTLLQSTANPGQLHTSQVSVGQIFQHILEASMDRINLKNVQLESNFDPQDLRCVHIDLDKVTIALLNIVINGIEAMEANTGVLSLSVTDQSGYIGFVIRDNGSGMSAEVQKQIYEPYFSQKTNGLGLGLASTLSVVHHHGGRIELDSQTGRGTTFTVFLPKAAE
jgi:signal transduction histidine kinase